MPVTRLVPLGAGDIRIAALVYGRRFSGAGLRRRGEIGGAKFDLDLDQWPEAQAYLLGRYDPATVEYVVRRLPADGVFVDGGSHVGLISFQVAARRPDVKIYAFEPHPSAAAGFRRNAELNSKARVELVTLALSNLRGEIAFDFDRHSAEGTPGGSVPSIRLDEFLDGADLERVDVVKLDVEGHELAALEGARRALEAGRITAVTMEAMHGDVESPARFLHDLGFRPVPLPDLRPRWLSRSRAPRLQNVAFERIRRRDAD